jgi:hypothetical protein
VVDRLQRSSSADVDDPAGWNIVALGRLTEKHRQTAGKDDERFVLLGVHVTLAVCARLIAPDVRAAVFEAGQGLQLSHMPSRLAGFVGTRQPLKLLGKNDRERHRATPYAASPGRARWQNLVPATATRTAVCGLRGCVSTVAGVPEVSPLLRDWTKHDMLATTLQAAIEFQSSAVETDFRTELSRLVIEQTQKRFPGVTFTFGSAIDAHHDRARFQWHAGPAEAPAAIVGFDAIVTEDGRIRNVYGFMDAAPAA